MYAFWTTINTIPPCPHSINSDSQHVQSASERKHLQSSLLCSDSQGKHCHPTGHSLFRTCKVPKSFHQANTTHTTLSSHSLLRTCKVPIKRTSHHCCAQTAKGNIVIPLETCKVPKSFHQANTTHTTLSSKLLSVTAKRMYAFWTTIPCRHAPMPSILILNMSNQQANGNISNRHCCAQTAKGNIVILLDTLCFEHAKYLSPFIKRTQPIPLYRQSYSQSQPSECMHSGRRSIPCRHAPMPSILILNMSNQQANGNISNRHCCAQTAKGNIVILLDTLCRTCKVPKSFHQANTTHTTLSSKLLSVTAKRMYAFWTTINTMPPCPHAINSDSQHVQSASERKHLQSSLLCSDSQGKHCHPTGHSLLRTCKVPKSFHQANTTHTTLSSKLLSVTAKRMYAFWTTINTMPPCPHAINSDSQHVQSASERKHLQSSLLCSDSQGKHCHPTGHSLLQTCKVPKSLHQANTTHTTLSSKLLSVTAKRMYAFWTTINTMPPCPHAINSDSQHVQSASERKHLQSSLLCSDSQGKHCHPTGHSLLRTCKVPKSFHQANTTHTTLSSKLLSVTAKRMHAFWTTINTMPPCPHAINSDSQHVQSASERKHLQSSLLCSDSQGKHCHPTGHSLLQTCKVPKSFHQANTTHTTLSSKLLSVTAKRMYAFWTTINTMPPCPHAINSDSQHVQSASERKHLQSSLLCSDSQGKHCHPSGHSLLRTCKVPKSFHQANTTHTTLSSKLLSVTAKRMHAFWTTINTMPPCPHAINSDSQHVQSASERKHLQSSLLCSDSQGKHCHPTGHTLFWTCKVHWSFHQANRTHSMTLWLYIQSYTSWLIIDMPACHHCNLCLDSYCQILAAYQKKNGFRLCFDFPHFTCQKIQSILLPRNGLTWSFFI